MASSSWPKKRENIMSVLNKTAILPPYNLATSRCRVGSSTLTSKPSCVQQCIQRKVGELFLHTDETTFAPLCRQTTPSMPA